MLYAKTKNQITNVMMLSKQKPQNHRKAPGGMSLKTMSKPHVFAAGAVLSAILGVLLLTPAEEVQAKRAVHTVELAFGEPLDPSNEPVGQKSVPSTDSLPGKTTSEPAWQTETVLPGDSLSTVFKRLSLSAQDVYQVASADHTLKAFSRLKPRETIAVALDNTGALAQVKYSRSQLESYLYQRGTSGFVAESTLVQPELRPKFVEARIESSLFLDASAIGLPQNKIMELAHIFGWDIDFALDIRSGDAFSVLYEEQYLNGKNIGTGNILAARFTNQGETYTALRFADKDGMSQYYTPDGHPMRKAFLRAPLDFTRISSSFNMRRKHPIHKNIRAHRGVDYAAPRGTPVYSAGKGRVTASGYSKANGNYVFVQHGGQYVTKYLHLNRRKVKKGQSVKQRQIIGSVGSTGYATGPHLHYEFLVSGVHRNPRTVKLPKAEPIPAHLKQRFTETTSPLLAQLETYTEYRVAAL